jgi:hypothetical protein
MPNAGFFESGCDVIPLVNQGDADTDITGDWVKLRDYDRCLLLIAKYGSEDVDTLGFQVLQATDASAGSAKGVTALFPYWTKQGTLTSQTVWTAGRLTTADDILSVGSAAASGGTLVTAVDVNTDAFLLAIEVQASDLDADGGFDWLTVRIEGDEVNNSCLISAWAILHGGKYKQVTPLSAIS